jgi:hypothetical protein
MGSCRGRRMLFARYSPAIGPSTRRKFYRGGFWTMARSKFAQTLGKQFFFEVHFELSENLRRILLDYAQNRAEAANMAFNRAC